MKKLSFKKHIAPVGAAIAVTTGLFCPLLNTHAASSYTVTFAAGTNHTVEAHTGHPNEILVDGATNFVTLSAEDASFSTNCTGTSSCTITVTHTDGTSDAPSTSLSYGQTDAFSFKIGDNVINAGQSFTGNTNVSIVDYVAQTGPEQNPGQNTGPEQGQPTFDGKAYLFWDCGKSDLCYHYFNNIPNDGTTAYYNANDIEADNHAGVKFNPATANSNNAGYSLKADWEGFIANHTTYGISDVAGPGKVDLNPVDSPKGNNSFTHFGDRNFKVVIKNNNFVGITVGSFNDLTYVPDFWDALSTPDLYDMSGTTASNPAILRTVLVEPTITLRASDGDANINITSVTPVNDLRSQDATITPKNDGTWSITFHSNYYDHEVFKITTTKGDHYVRIVRQAVVGEVPMGLEQTSYNATATVYYPSSFSCDDFTVTAKIIYTNKNPKTVKMEEAESFDDGLGNMIQGCEAEGGKNLKQGHFVYPLGNSISNIEGIYFNVSKKSNSTTSFGGVFSGSGQGTYYDINSRQIDWTK